MTTDHTEALAELSTLWAKADDLQDELQRVKAEIREKAIAIAPFQVGDEAVLVQLGRRNTEQRVRIHSVKPRPYQTREGVPSYEYTINKMKKDGTYGTGVFNAYGRLEPVTAE